MVFGRLPNSFLRLSTNTEKHAKTTTTMVTSIPRVSSNFSSPKTSKINNNNEKKKRNNKKTTTSTDSKQSKVKSPTTPDATATATQIDTQQPEEIIVFSSDDKPQPTTPLKDGKTETNDDAMSTTPTPTKAKGESEENETKDEATMDVDLPEFPPDEKRDHLRSIVEQSFRLDPHPAFVPQITYPAKVDEKRQFLSRWFFRIPQTSEEKFQQEMVSHFKMIIKFLIKADPDSVIYPRETDISKAKGVKALHPNMKKYPTTFEKFIHFFPRFQYRPGADKYIGSILVGSNNNTSTMESKIGGFEENGKYGIRLDSFQTSHRAVELGWLLYSGPYTDATAIKQYLQGEYRSEFSVEIGIPSRGNIETRDRLEPTPNPWKTYMKVAVIYCHPKNQEKLTSKLLEDITGNPKTDDTTAEPQHPFWGGMVFVPSRTSDPRNIELQNTITKSWNRHAEWINDNHFDEVKLTNLVSGAMKLPVYGYTKCSLREFLMSLQTPSGDTYVISIDESKDKQSYTFIVPKLKGERHLGDAESTNSIAIGAVTNNLARNFLKHLESNLRWAQGGKSASSFFSTSTKRLVKFQESSHKNETSSNDWATKLATNQKKDRVSSTSAQRQLKRTDKQPRTCHPTTRNFVLIHTLLHRGNRRKRRKILHRDYRRFRKARLQQ